MMLMIGHDLATIGLLVLLEGLLSADNALVLAVLVRRLPAKQRKQALRYGIVGAFFFRFIALLVATWLIHAWYFKLSGALYLIYIGLAHLLHPQKSHEPSSSLKGSFWRVVISVELTDVAFSIDSILAAVAMSEKLWVIYVGGIAGIIAMRFVAGAFITLLDRMPGLIFGAYLLVIWIGLKLLLGGWAMAADVLGSTYWGWTAQDIARLTWIMPHWLFWAGMGSILLGSMLCSRQK